MLEWIPQLFYDLLARIVPGGILILMTLVVYQGPSQLWTSLLEGKWDKATNFTPLAIFIAASYVIGFLFGELWDRCQQLVMWLRTARQERRGDPSEPPELRLLRWCVKEHHMAEHVKLDAQTCIRKKGGEEECNIKVGKVPALASIRDILRMQAQREVSLLLTKLRSEKRLCEVLVLGFGLLAIAQLLAYRAAALQGERLIVEAFLAAAWLACWGKAGSLRRFSLTCAYNSLLVSTRPEHSHTEAEPALEGGE